MRLRVLSKGVVAIVGCVACGGGGGSDPGSDASADASVIDDAGDASVGTSGPSTGGTSTSQTPAFDSDGGSAGSESTDLTHETSANSNATPNGTGADSGATDLDAGGQGTAPDASTPVSTEPQGSTEPSATSSTNPTTTTQGSTAVSLDFPEAGSPDAATSPSDAGDGDRDADVAADATDATSSTDESDLQNSSEGTMEVSQDAAPNTTELSTSQDAAPNTTNASSTQDSTPSTTDVPESSLDAGSSEPSWADADAANPEGGTLDSGPDAEAPALLTSLQIQGGRYALKPAFDPAITRYSVVASTGSEVLTLTATNGASLPMTVNGQPLPEGAAVTLDAILPGNDINLTLGDESSSGTEYVIKYLPPSFPDLVVTQSLPGASTDPLYTTINVPNANFAVKMDNNGVPFYWVQSGSRLFDFKKHPNGLMSYAFWVDPNNTGAEQVLLDSDYNEVDRLRSVGLVNTDFHEFSILPNGNFVFLAYEPAMRDLSPFGGSSSGQVKDSVFQEVSPDSNVLFEWNSWEHFDYGDSVYALTPTDYAHANTVYVDDDNNWLVSFRGYSQILKIHRTTGNVIWRLGGLDSDFTFINDPFEGPCGQHTPTRLENGNLLIFDNGRDCVPDVSNGRQGQTRIVEYDVDEVAMTAELVWSYDRPGEEALSQGSAVRLDNGNTLIGWGAGPSLLATEVAPNGDVVFEIEARPQTGDSSSYRVGRFPD